MFQVAEKRIVIIDMNMKPKTRLIIYKKDDGYIEEPSTVWDNRLSRTFTE
jgi:hypothetical protein